jgi:hypothetical protein
MEVCTVCFVGSKYCRDQQEEEELLLQVLLSATYQEMNKFFRRMDISVTRLATFTRHRDPVSTVCSSPF